MGKTEKEEDLTLIDEFAGFFPPARSTHRPAVGRTDLVEGGDGCVGRGWGWGRARRGWNGVKWEHPGLQARKGRRRPSFFSRTYSGDPLSAFLSHSPAV